LGRGTIWGFVRFIRFLRTPLGTRSCSSFAAIDAFLARPYGVGRVQSSYGFSFPSRKGRGLPRIAFPVRGRVGRGIIPLHPPLRVGGLRPLRPSTHGPNAPPLMRNKRIKSKKVHPSPRTRKKRIKRRKYPSPHEPPPLGGSSPRLLDGPGCPTLAQEGRQGAVLAALGVPTEQVVDLGPRQSALAGVP
jgi:hypothetical protein